MHSICLNCGEVFEDGDPLFPANFCSFECEAIFADYLEREADAEGVDDPEAAPLS